MSIIPKKWGEEHSEQDEVVFLPMSIMDHRPNPFDVSVFEVFDFRAKLFAALKIQTCPAVGICRASRAD